MLSNVHRWNGISDQCLPNVDALTFRHIPCQFVPLCSSHWSVLSFYVEIIVFVIISLYWWLRARVLSDWKLVSLQSHRVETWRKDNLISDYTVSFVSIFMIRRTVCSSDLQLTSYMDTEWTSRLSRALSVMSLERDGRQCLRAVTTFEMSLDSWHWKLWATEKSDDYLWYVWKKISRNSQERLSESHDEVLDCEE